MKLQIYLKYFIKLNFLYFYFFNKGEYQLQQLIVAFKDLLGVFNEKSVNKEAKVITKPIFYPLNQYHKDFVEKAKKGITEINWMHVIDQIQNEFNECDEDTRNLNEIWNT